MKHVHNVNHCFTYNSPKLENTKIAVNRQTDKQSVVYWSNEILLSNKREWAIETHLEESQNTYDIKAREKRQLLYDPIHLTF